MITLLLVLMFAQSPVQAAAVPAAPELHLRLVRDGHTRFHIEAEAVVAAPESVVWGTIRDYDHLTGFIPMLVMSRRTVYDGHPAIEQIGRAKLLFIHFDAKAVFEEAFDPSTGSLTLRLLAGDFVRFDSSWHAKSISPTVTLITVSSEAQLKRWVPQWLERWQVRKTVAQSLEALLLEMQRRAKTRY